MFEWAVVEDACDQVEFHDAQVDVDALLELSQNPPPCDHEEEAELEELLDPPPGPVMT